MICEDEMHQLLLQLSECEDDYETLIVEMSDMLSIPRVDVLLFVRRWSRYEEIVRAECPDCLIRNSKSLISECVAKYPQLGELAEPHEVKNSILGELIRLDREMENKREKVVGSHLCCTPNCNNKTNITLEDYRCLVSDIDSMTLTILNLICDNCITNQIDECFQ